MAAGRARIAASTVSASGRWPHVGARRLRETANKHGLDHRKGGRLCPSPDKLAILRRNEGHRIVTVIDRAPAGPRRR
jgi:hypothetical protein